MDGVNRRIGIIIIRITYGYYVQSANDPFLTTPLMAMTNFSIATKPGNFLVDLVPSRMFPFFELFLKKLFLHHLFAVKHIPLWMPGSGFLKTAAEMHNTLWGGIWNNFQWCKTNLVWHPFPVTYDTWNSIFGCKVLTFTPSSI